MRPLRVNSLPFTHIGFCLKWVLPRPVFRWVICSNAVLPIKENPWTTVEGAVPSRPLSQSLSPPPPPPWEGPHHFWDAGVINVTNNYCCYYNDYLSFCCCKLEGGGERSYIKSMSVDVLSHVEKQQVGLIHGTTLVLFLFVSFSVWGGFFFFF